LSDGKFTDFPKMPMFEGAPDNLNDRWQIWFTEIADAMPRAFSVTWNPASVLANTSAEQTVSVTGLKVTDIVTLNKPTLTAGLGIVNVRVSTSDTLAITFQNSTGSAIDPPSEKYRGFATKS